ncbi:LLM class flavin-dependent oxidoreductase [Actinokineospora auranticolor]|uniref:Alkanesulfonate monooxygenase SsuD/methylene tetrahydromethanopterin reductase-like flavin-dependent oxidoreductase (Luciferase family) n=1 Tax=Actinokineospora auranticolor TaxID=155976 RepID=A0A2S6GLR0_9PSEU|nr:LLM class flavin-dependent oxidoreductase [Actinokineospora auranticolor]PPK66168.1 alkanesulfonate monooxygenase SsuD/methylene tetrahydromethanopterin reductase-like flavin-dependent oxidoreductase (luciferase family) [Actinokineospora auranticolor]
MRVGLGYLNMAPAGDAATTAASHADLFHDVRWAQDKGFAGIWITEHHFSTYSLTSAPLLLLAKASAIAPGLRLGTSIVVLPFWDPVRLATDALTLDALTGGRFDLGIGRGYQPHEFLAFGKQVTQNRALFEEALEVIMRVFTTEDFTFEGEHFRVDAPMTVLPRPTQTPHPPVWMAATSRESLRTAVRRGFNPMLPAVTTLPEIHERRRWILEEGGDLDRVEFQVNRFVYCGEDAESRELVVREIARQLMTSAGLTRGVHPVRGTAVTPDELDPAYLEKARGLLVSGSSDEVVARFRELVDAGITYVIAGFNFGYLPKEVALRSMETFASEVLPHVDRLSPQTVAG